ncbi:hypothetical protein [Oceanobacillus rekensis]|uniref:hypothetical protein n=1 Tax=Oceanobacillus rekensis TaxID=937927 RepID=UPI000B44DC0D|nr:hypothetical protein [Oceanobacillus rekensis]
MNKNYNELNILAAKHKKIFEKYDINPGVFKINDNEYYFAFYKRRKITGYAIISSQSSNNKEEYIEAFKSLSRYYQYSGSVIKHAGFRAAINFNSFTTVSGFLQKVLTNLQLSPENRAIFRKGLDALNFIINLQDQLIKDYEIFLTRARQVESGEIKFITKDLLDNVLNYLSEFDYIQYTQMTTQYNNISTFKEIYNQAKNDQEIKPFMDEAAKTYLGEFTISKANLQKNIKELTHVPNLEQLTKEEHREVARKTTVQNTEKFIEKHMKKLRHPKI